MSGDSRLPDRIYAAIPADNPIFHELREYLSQFPRNGAQSRIPQIAAHFLLLGFLFQRGLISTGGNAGEIAERIAQSSGFDPREFDETQKAIEQSNEWGFS